MIWLLSPGSSPPRVTVILFAEYEKVSVLTALEPMFWLSWATSDLPG